MTKKQKKNLVTAVTIGGVGFLSAVFLIPLIKLKPVALGEDPTAMHKIQDWFVKAKDFIGTNWIWIGALVLGGYVLYQTLKKK